MAKEIVKEMYTIKKYSEEAKAKLEAMIKELKPTMQSLDSIDNAIAITPTPTTEMLKAWARQAQGLGNYIRKKQAKLTAAAINEKDSRYMEIKIECSTQGIKFTDSTAKLDAEGYIAPLRTARDILEAYVISADNIVSVCRMHLNSHQQDSTNPVEV